MFTLTSLFLFDHLQIALIHGPNISGSYADFSLQHCILLLSPVPSTTGCCFCFGSITSFFLELFLHWSPVAYGAPTDLGSSSFIVLSFCYFILFMGFSSQEYWSGLPFPSPVDQVLSDLSNMICPSWVAPHPRVWLSFTELDKAVVHVIRLASWVPDELWMEVRDIVQKTGSKNIPKEKKCKTAKWMSEEAL